MDFEYYYNYVPGKGFCRNNLIYTSLISKDRKTFCQWYYNDTDYHRGQNQVVNLELMDEKFYREVKFLTIMGENFPSMIPKFDININEKKIYLEIDGPDMWEMVGCCGVDYSTALPDWDNQMLKIFEAHKSLGLFKYSLHPSSYFIVGGELKSMNYFFTYDTNDDNMSIRSVLSHISEDRQKDLFPKISAMGFNLDDPVPHKKLQHLAFESFKTNFKESVMNRAKEIYDI